jgi:hypothetical protein
MREDISSGGEGVMPGPVLAGIIPFAGRAQRGRECMRERERERWLAGRGVVGLGGFLPFHTSLSPLSARDLGSLGDG